MIKTISVSGIDSITKTPYEDIMREIQSIPQYETHVLPELSVEGRPVYGFSLGDTSNKKTMYFQAQIHGGHEWRTTHWIRKFMEILVNPSDFPYPYTISYLKSKYNFYFIPCVNPDGYVNGRYLNANGVAVDANFDWNWDNYNGNFDKGAYPFSEPEARNVRDVVLSILPVSFVCCHTWGDGRGLKIRHPQNRSIEVLLHDYYKSSTLHDINNSGNEFVSRNSNASAYNWAGDITSRNNRKIVASVLETGSMDSDYVQSKLGINALFLKCLHVDNYLSSGEQRLDSR